MQKLEGSWVEEWDSLTSHRCVGSELTFRPKLIDPGGKRAKPSWPLENWEPRDLQTFQEKIVSKLGGGADLGADPGLDCGHG